MITEEIKKRIFTIFDSWETLMGERKDINKEITDLVKEAADLAETSAKEVRKYFANKKKRNDSGEDELEKVNKLAADLEA